jgi:hypothetical protein
LAAKWSEYRSEKVFVVIQIRGDDTPEKWSKVAAGGIKGAFTERLSMNLGRRISRMSPRLLCKH